MAPRVTISARHCKGCKLCLGVCPRGALKLTGKLSEAGIELVGFDESIGCSGCLLCTTMCPDAAITVEIEEESVSGKRKG